MQRKENKCDKLSILREGMMLECMCNRLCDCPKTRNRCIITTACWRIRR